MKASDILIEVLSIFENKYDCDMPGICDNLMTVCYKLSGLYRRELFDTGFKYVEKYKPLKTSLYWWPTDNIESRITVLKKAIADALAEGD